LVTFGRSGYPLVRKTSKGKKTAKEEVVEENFLNYSRRTPNNGERVVKL
jgi:hypothetical protein